VPDLGGRSELDGGRAIPVWPENPDDVNSRAVSAGLGLACAMLFPDCTQQLVPSSLTAPRPGRPCKSAHCNAPAAPALPARPQVWSLMNLAYAHHEIISDYVTAALIWFETGCVGGWQVCQWVCQSKMRQNPKFAPPC
jgi:hypothetical protein